MATHGSRTRPSRGRFEDLQAGVACRDPISVAWLEPHDALAVELRGAAARMQATRSSDHIKEALGRTTPQLLRSLRARLEDPSPSDHRHPRNVPAIGQDADRPTLSLILDLDVGRLPELRHHEPTFKRRR